MKLEKIIARNNRLLESVNKRLERKNKSLKLAQICIERKSKLLELTEMRLDRNQQFLGLYKSGLNYEDIAAKHNLSIIHLKRIIKKDVEFQCFLKEQQDAKNALVVSKEDILRRKLLDKNLLKLHPEETKVLWDYEKNGDLKPENILAKTTKVLIWFKCPIDGYSWQKNPSEITRGWVENRSSGCPSCANRTKKKEKQFPLSEIYPELVEKYWNFQKNKELGLCPDIVTLSSNREAWFKCPDDGNEWKIIIARLVHQQWSKGNNTGCRVCNGTNNRSRSKWQHQESLKIVFPEEISQYWIYKANSELNLDPDKLTIRSNRKAWFRCPIDGHEWQATIQAITRSWQNKNSGCGACRGLIATTKTSLATLYPDDVAKYWDYKKNNAIQLYPFDVTKGSSREIWLKCPDDGNEWKAKIFSITRSWMGNRNGCASCAETKRLKLKKS